ncbi:hypothetical protein [Glycomyces buryatensis]|uniref:Uncharacterized protein n=1 Tax=Glycomyces buryatensis TaxID=2570927 RepID=A0A4S8QA55_9ACTN|nr:hypothetical protein [Glycomyces buryatensis]THV41140.1 hypothetical protein FAB82_12860 [Glycomyces buryatensis]
MDTHRPAWSVRLLVPVLGVLVFGLLGACGTGGGPGEETSSAEPTTESASETAASESPTPAEDSMSEETTPSLDPSMGSEEPGEGGTLTISGTVESGVESGCLVLEYDGTVYGIYGDYDSSVVKSGASVTLSGHLEPDMMTTCQQGTPFVVEEAETAD